ncbi:MAG: UvrD-helicase domain-containing protein [Candidatus Methanomethylophilaceae archaeon]|nr:UvrD-helicase domain-containing protein [Candidatus Methanomethylophilaceae archaeon]
MSLNDNQKQVAETLNGLLMVDAGPGTGKTHTIVERYANLVKDKVPVRDILMVTFTRNAAEEMKDRISRRMRDYAKELRD